MCVMVATISEMCFTFSNFLEFLYFFYVQNQELLENNFTVICTVPIKILESLINGSPFQPQESL